MSGKQNFDQSKAKQAAGAKAAPQTAAQAAKPVDKNAKLGPKQAGPVAGGFVAGEQKAKAEVKPLTRNEQFTGSSNPPKK